MAVDGFFIASAGELRSNDCIMSDPANETPLPPVQPVESIVELMRARPPYRSPNADPLRVAAPKKSADARLEAVGGALSDATRWRILLELGKGSALPVGELSKRVGKRPDLVSKHMAMLRKAGLVVRVFSTCYTLPPEMLPEPGASTLDLGPCLLKLALPQ